MSDIRGQPSTTWKDYSPEPPSRTASQFPGTELYGSNTQWLINSTPLAWAAAQVYRVCSAVELTSLRCFDVER